MPAAVPAPGDRPPLLVDTVRAEYGDAGRLLVRQRLYRHERPPLDIHGLVARRVAGCGGVLVDVGCGVGSTLGRLSRRPGRLIVGIDISASMLSVARTALGDCPLAAADIAALPLPDGVASAVVAVHVLYLLPDPGAAVAELARVLRPDGLLVVVTTAADDKVLIQRLVTDALAGHIDPKTVRSGDLHQRFPARAAAATMRAQHFHVRATHLRGAIRLADPAPLVDYIASLGPRYAPGTSPRAWAHATTWIEATLTQAVANGRELVVPTHLVLLSGCRRAALAPPRMRANRSRP